MENNRFKKNRNDKFANKKENTEAVSEECVVAGRNAVRELLGGTRDIEKIYVQGGEREGSVKLLVALAREKKLPVVEVDKTKLDAISRGERHQGIVAIASERNYYEVEDILEYAKECNEPPFIVMLDGVEDPYNFGYAIRSLYAAGVSGIVLPPRNWMSAAGVVARSSAGASVFFISSKIPG